MNETISPPKLSAHGRFISKGNCYIDVIIHINNVTVKLDEAVHMAISLLQELEVKK